MNENSRTDRIRKVGASARQLFVLLVSALVVVATFAGMGYLVYRGELSEGPLVLFAGVILGYVLRVVQDYA